VPPSCFSSLLLKRTIGLLRRTTPGLPYDPPPSPARLEALAQVIMNGNSTAKQVLWFMMKRWPLRSTSYLN